MASIIEQIFTQAGAASAQGQSLPLTREFQRGQQLRLQRERFEIDRRQALEDIETANLQQQQFAQTLRFNEQMNKFDLVDAMSKQEQLMRDREFQTAASGMLMNAKEEPNLLDDPEYQSNVFELLKYPGSLGFDEGQQLFNMIQEHQLKQKGFEQTQQTFQAPGGGTATFETPQDIDPLDQFQAQMRSVEAKLRAQQLQIQAQKVRSGLDELDRRELDARLERFTGLAALKMSEAQAAKEIANIIDEFRNRLPGGNQGSIFGDIEIPDAPELGRRGDRTVPSREAILPRSEQRRLRQGSSQNLGQDFDFQFNPDTGRLEPAR